MGRCLVYFTILGVSLWLYFIGVDDEQGLTYLYLSTQRILLIIQTLKSYSFPVAKVFCEPTKKWTAVYINVHKQLLFIRG